jgi:hypothetical protein
MQTKTCLLKMFTWGVWRYLFHAVLLIPLIWSVQPTSAQAPLRDTLKALPFKIAYESYADGNSDILVMNADGSNPVKLTQTPTEQEHYPQISPDGSKMCFVSDVGRPRYRAECLCHGY